MNIQTKEIIALEGQDLDVKVNGFLNSLPKETKIQKIKYKVEGTTRYSFIIYEVTKDEGKPAGFNL